MCCTISLLFMSFARLIYFTLFLFVSVIKWAFLQKWGIIGLYFASVWSLISRNPHLLPINNIALWHYVISGYIFTLVLPLSCWILQPVFQLFVFHWSICDLSRTQWMINTALLSRLQKKLVPNLLAGCFSLITGFLLLYLIYQASQIHCVPQNL